MVCKTSDTGRAVREESTTPALSMTTLASEFALPYLLNVGEDAHHRTIPSNAPPYTTTFAIPRARRASMNADEVSVFRLYKVSHQADIIVPASREACTYPRFKHVD